MRILHWPRSWQARDKLKEVSLECTIEELDKVINFLSDVRIEHAAISKKTVMCCHSHLRDWDAVWTKEEPDIIVVTAFSE